MPPGGDSPSSGDVTRNQFCTLFDVNYLSRGLVLYRSLARWCDDFQLRVYCVDAASRELLDELALPRLETVGFDELERDDPALAAVKSTRSPVEYCWTATPAVCAHALAREPGLDRITYLDADLMFFAEPSPIFDEIGDASVAIVPHRYAPQWSWLEEPNGIYNVQFMMFRRDDRGLAALGWWRERCLEWCYARVEDGKMGDQKYLDDWPERFPGVHVLEHPGGGLAPWNAESHTLTAAPAGPLVDGRPLVFFHYHSLKVYRGGVARLRRAGLFRGASRFASGPARFLWSVAYPVRREELELVWAPYLRALGGAYEELRRLRPGFHAGFVRPPLRDLLPDSVRRLLRGARHARRQLEVRRHVHRESWKSESVARQMQALTTAELESPEDVAPLRVFLAAAEVLATELSLPRPAAFLDIGCGVGHYSDLLEDHFPGRFDYTGCDYADEMVAAARAARPGRSFVVNDLLHNSLDLGRYDVLCASALIDVLSEFEDALDVLLGAPSPVVLLHRQRVTTRPSHVTAVAGYDGQKTYSVSLSSAELGELAERHGRTIVRSFVVEGDVSSFILERAAA